MAFTEVFVTSPVGSGFACAHLGVLAAWAAIGPGWRPGVRSWREERTAADVAHDATGSRIGHDTTDR